MDAEVALSETAKSSKGAHLWRKGVSGNPRGRKPGTVNRVTATMVGVMKKIVVERPEWLERKLIRLADSDEPIDRRTFWMMLSKLVPAQVELDAKQGGSLEALILARLPSSSIVKVLGDQGQVILDHAEGPAPDPPPSPQGDPREAQGGGEAGSIPVSVHALSASTPALSPSTSPLSAHSQPAPPPPP